MLHKFLIKIFCRKIHRCGRIKGPKSHDPFRKQIYGKNRIFKGTLNSKRAPRGYTKGYRTWKLGRYTKRGYKLYDHETLKNILNFNIPNLENFNVIKLTIYFT